MDHPRQPPRRLGQRRRRSRLRRGRAARGGARPSASWSSRAGSRKRTIVYLRVGRRGAGPARLDRVGRAARRRAAAARPSPTSTPTPTAAASSSMAGSHTLEKFINGVARDIEDPETKISVVEARCSSQRIADGTPAERQELRARAPTCASARSARARTTPPSSTTSASRRSTSASAARTAAASTTPSTTISTGTRASPTPISSTAARWRRRSGPRCMRLAERGPAAVRLRRTSPTPSAATSDEVQKLARRASASETDGAQPRRSTRASSTRHRRPPQSRWSRRPRRRAAVPEFRAAARTRWPRCTRAAEQLRDGAGARLALRGAWPATEPINALLMAIERALTRRRPARRPWFRHQIYAPGFYTGYGVKTLPGVREASSRSSGRRPAADRQAWPGCWSRPRNGSTRPGGSSRLRSRGGHGSNFDQPALSMAGPVLQRASFLRLFDYPINAARESVSAGSCPTLKLPAIWPAARERLP